MKQVVGINGFGRFGLHLLKYWLDRSSVSFFKLDYINDDYLDIKRAQELIINDKYVKFNKYKVQIAGDYLVILEPNGLKHEILFSNDQSSSISWLGEPDIVFECSGKNTEAKNCSGYFTNKTKTVLISATSWDSEKTLVYGFNHEEYHPDLKLISYGSCTVNAYLPLGKWMEEEYEISDSDVNVIHNIQEYRLTDNQTLNRKFCTLEESAKILMPSVNDDNFLVNYTVIPYTGVSMIDFRFKLKKKVNKDTFIKGFEKVINFGNLKGLYGLIDKDTGPEVHNCTIFSTVFIKENIKIIGNNVYLQGYFDNENSVNRFYDLASYISKQAEISSN